MVMSRNGKVNGNGEFDWTDAIVDSILVGAYTGIASLIATGNLTTSFEAGALATIGWLMTKRGLVKK